jgi:hypothetical protein
MFIIAIVSHQDRHDGTPRAPARLQTPVTSAPSEITPGRAVGGVPRGVVAAGSPGVTFVLRIMRRDISRLIEPLTGRGDRPGHRGHPDPGRRRASSKTPLPAANGSSAATTRTPSPRLPASPPSSETWETSRQPGNWTGIP